MSPGDTAPSLDAARAHHQAGNLEMAAAAYERVLSSEPDSVEALLELGNVRDAQGASNDAIACYRRVVALRPDHAGAHCNLGTVLHALGRLSEAIAAYRLALAAQPDLFEAHYNVALACQALGRNEEAIAALRAALALRPAAKEAHYALGLALRDADQSSEAVASFARALDIDPHLLDARWSAAMAELPWVYSSSEEPARCRDRFAAALESLVRWFEVEVPANAELAVGGDLPFGLAYQEENNRELMARYGALCSRLMGQWHGGAALPRAPRRAGRPLRLGIASAHLRRQSAWMAITRGWFEALDPGRVALYAFHLGEAPDAETAFARSRAARFEQGPKTLREWVETIRACELDALIYPDIGMDGVSIRLAALRLAPLQAGTWGHPDTTGLPTIDYFFSAELLEPAGAQEHYTERLVLLPGVGCHFHPQSEEPLVPDLAAWGVDPTQPLLVCAGVPFKYAPQFDWVLAEIAARLGSCQLLFFRHFKPQLTRRMEARLRESFARRGVAFDDHVRFAPWLDGRSFHGVLSRADVYLDTIGFSGFNTGLQALEASLPVVTREGRFLRGRLASGLLKRIGMGDLVAPTEQAYVDLAVRLVEDDEHSEAIAERIDAALPGVYGDTAPVRALEEFLIRTVESR